jgi:23S rRNA (guanine2445-N2)-methyltransferase / 23S rRNA (guanine2069-N7)-methyltransferase
VQNKKDLTLFATAPRGVERVLFDELTAMGVESPIEGRGGVRFEGDLEMAMRVCLWSRVANRLLLPLKKFRAETPEALYDGVQAINWAEHFSVTQTFAVDAKLSSSKISHSQYAALKIKDAVVDQFRDACGERPSVERDQPDVRLNLHLYRDEATISLDLSGDSLHRRGYRAETMAAPLKENLAATILLRAGWPKISQQGGALFDPMCGSGTLLIEGAMIAADIAPSYQRDYYGFMGWSQFDSAAWARLREEAKIRREKGLLNLPPIAGSDASIKTAGIAKANVKAAGLSDKITIFGESLSQVKAHGDWQLGLFVCNPPYGERMGEVEQLKLLYHEIGTILQARFSGWNASVFTGNPDLAFQIPLRSHKSYKLFNGALECKLFNFEVSAERHFEVKTPIVEGVWGSSVKKALLPSEGELSQGAQMLSNRLKKNLKNLRRWAKREGISCYRVYDADLPEYALAIDLYDGEQRAVHVQEYEAPKTVDAEKALERLRDALAVIPELLDVPQEQLYLKVRRRQKGMAQYEKQDVSGGFFEVTESGLKFLVNLKDYLDTGLFLDHRTTRQMIGELAAGKRFLNLFAYTGTASVYAAQGGATSTTTVDMSNTYLEWAGKNLALNGYKGERHQIVRANCLEWLKAEKEKGGQFDLIFLDPPTFSNSKRMENEFDVQRDHVELIEDAMALLSPEGVLVFSTNNRKFRLDEEKLSVWTIEDVSRKTLPKDYERNPKIHYCWKISRS